MKKIAKIAGAVLAVLLVSVAAYTLWNRESRIPPATVTGPAAMPERSLSYSITVQKMDKGRPPRPIGEPYDAAGNELFGDGWKFRLNIVPEQSGSLYLLNEDADAGKLSYNALFPTVKNNAGLPQLSSKQRMETDWYYFVDQPGVEKLWFIWAKQEIPELDSIFKDAIKRDGVISDASQVSKIQTYLKQYESQPPEVISQQSQKLTVIRGKTDTVVALVELSHLQR